VADQKPYEVRPALRAHKYVGLGGHVGRPYRNKRKVNCHYQFRSVKSSIRKQKNGPAFFHSVLTSVYFTWTLV
jgi:hypothetical protein